MQLRLKLQVNSDCLMNVNSMMTRVALFVALVGLSFGVIYKLTMKIDSLEAESQHLDVLLSFRATEDSLSGKHINLVNVVSRRDYGEPIATENFGKFPGHHEMTLVLLFSSQSCQLCVAKSGEICKMADSLSRSLDCDVLAIGSGPTLDNVLGYARLGGLDVPLFWDHGEIYRKLGVPEGKVYMFLVSSKGRILRALVFEHSEALTYHEVKFEESVLNIADTKLTERR